LVLLMPVVWGSEDSEKFLQDSSPNTPQVTTYEKARVLTGEKDGVIHMYIVDSDNTLSYLTANNADGPFTLVGTSNDYQASSFNWDRVSRIPVDVWKSPENSRLYTTEDLFKTTGELRSSSSSAGATQVTVNIVGGSTSSAIQGGRTVGVPFEHNGERYVVNANGVLKVAPRGLNQPLLEIKDTAVMNINGRLYRTTEEIPGDWTISNNGKSLIKGNGENQITIPASDFESVRSETSGLVFTTSGGENFVPAVDGRFIVSEENNIVGYIDDKGRRFVLKTDASRMSMQAVADQNSVSEFATKFSTDFQPQNQAQINDLITKITAETNPERAENLVKEAREKLTEAQISRDLREQLKAEIDKAELESMRVYTLPDENTKTSRQLSSQQFPVGISQADIERSFRALDVIARQEGGKVFWGDGSNSGTLYLNIDNKAYVVPISEEGKPLMQIRTDALGRRSVVVFEKDKGWVLAEEATDAPATITSEQELPSSDVTVIPRSHWLGGGFRAAANINAMLGQFASAGAAGRRFSNLFFGEGTMDIWKDEIDKTIGKIFSVDHWTSEMCKVKVKTESGKQLAMQVSLNPQGTIVTCGGQRQAYVTPSGETQYFYLITYMVQNFGNDIHTYNIELQGQRIIPLYRQEQEVDTKKGLSLDNPFVSYSTVFYDRCCVYTSAGSYSCNSITDATTLDTATRSSSGGTGFNTI
ncbi:MAG: hypothetical protein ACMXYC_02305, partial [Candidatus Woesearchaeota archaeon]